MVLSKNNSIDYLGLEKTGAHTQSQTAIFSLYYNNDVMYYRGWQTTGLR